MPCRGTSAYCADLTARASEALAISALVASTVIQPIPRASSARSLSPYTPVPQVSLKKPAASPVSSAIATATRRATRVGPYLATSVIAPMSSAPARTAAAT